jgi:hypothetical protein
MIMARLFYFVVEREQEKCSQVAGESNVEIC